MRLQSLLHIASDVYVVVIGAINVTCLEDMAPTAAMRHLIPSAPAAAQIPCIEAHV